MIVVIVGASGFLGTHLIKYMLGSTENQIVAISRHATAISVDPQYAPRVALVDADVFDEEQMTEAMIGADVAYFFVHMMGQKK